MPSTRNDVGVVVDIVENEEMVALVELQVTANECESGNARSSKPKLPTKEKPPTIKKSIEIECHDDMIVLASS